MKRILAYGDSNTWGFDPGRFERYSADVRWTGLLQKTLKNKALIIEEGLCGRTTAFDDDTIPGANGLAALPTILEADRPLDIAVIMLGSNDCKSVFHASSDDVTAGLEKCLIKLLDVVSPENTLLISPLYLKEAAVVFGCDSRSLALSRDLKPSYKALADKYGVAFLAASDVAEASDVDGLHLTKEGHFALYEAILNSITPMINNA